MSRNGSRTRRLRYARQRSGMTAGSCDGFRDDRRQRQRAVMLGPQREVMLGLVPSICCGEGCPGGRCPIRSGRRSSAQGEDDGAGTTGWRQSCDAGGRREPGRRRRRGNGSRTRCPRCARQRSGMTAERTSASRMTAERTGIGDEGGRTSPAATYLPEATTVRSERRRWRSVIRPDSSTMASSIAWRCFFRRTSCFSDLSRVRRICLALEPDGS